MRSFKRDRPTIGVLPGWSPMIGNAPDRYLSSILHGIETAAHHRKCHLLVAWGVRQEVLDSTNQFPAWPVVSPDADFVPVGPENTDGLIVLAPLRDARRSAYLEQLSRQGFPVLYVATGENGPTIAPDNMGGIQRAVWHLHEHGHQRIAFIAGDPLDTGDSELRLSGYRASVQELGLPSDPRLIVQGLHTLVGGYEAFKRLHASGVEFTAMVVSDDNSAIGAMRAAHEAGLRIPADLAVIGFDDQPEAMAQVPPLATVHVPLQAMGQQAAVMMHDHLTSDLPLESINIPTRLVPRHSCGCMPAAVLSAAHGEASHLAAESTESETDLQREERIRAQIVNEMLAALPADLRLPAGNETGERCRSIVESFYLSLQGADPTRFQDAMFELMLTSELQDVNMDLWQEMISVLRRSMSVLPLPWEEARTRGLAEDLLHQARAAISDSAQRRDQRHQFQGEQKAHQLGLLASRLSTTLDENQVIAVLKADLSSIGVRSAHVAVFEPEGDDPVAWSILPGHESDSPLHRFRTRVFPPPGLVPPGELFKLSVLPLLFQNEALGYMAFDADDLGSCTAVSIRVAGALKAARLHQQVVELSLTDPLTGLHNRRYFDLLLRSEVIRSHRFARALAVLLVDVDYLKTYNDAYGHQAADEALKSVARCLTAGRRNADVVARIGGDEFALILPETDMSGARRVADKINQSVGELTELKRPITFSMGAAILPPGEMSPEGLISMADQALYASKRNGRNQISMFNSVNSQDARPAP